MNVEIKTTREIDVKYLKVEQVYGIFRTPK